MLSDANLEVSHLNAAVAVPVRAEEHVGVDHAGVGILGVLRIVRVGPDAEVAFALGDPVVPSRPACPVPVAQCLVDQAGVGQVASVLDHSGDAEDGQGIVRDGARQ